MQKTLPAPAKPGDKPDSRILLAANHAPAVREEPHPSARAQLIPAVLLAA
jgi:hypothetical protein